MKKRVLVVDDNQERSQPVESILSNLGYSTQFSESDPPPLDFFNAVEFPMAVINGKQPNLPGFLKKIKRSNAHAELIVISGSEDSDKELEYLESGATDVIPEPLNEKRLKLAVERAQEKIDLRRKVRSCEGNLNKMVNGEVTEVIELERQAAVSQIIEGMAEFITKIADDLESDTRYLNEMPCFISVHNRNFEVVAMNQLYEKRLDGKIGRPSWEVYKGDAGSKETCPVGKTIKAGKEQRSREVVRSFSTMERPVMVHTMPVMDRNGEVELILEMAADIRAVTNLKEELRTSQRRYQQLFDESPCYISVQDKNLRITASNKKFKEDFGDEIGGYCFEIYKHRTDECFNCPIRETFRDGKSHYTEEIVTSKSGEQYHVMTNTAPIRSVSGEITHVMEMSTNITQIRNLEDNLMSLGLLLGSMSHGIRGILTALDGGIYRLESGIKKENPDQINEAADVIKEMVSRIRDMVLDILYYAKERELDLSKVDILRFSNDVVSTVRPKAEKENIRFSCEFAEGLSEFEIDPSVVSPALVNLLENAIDACVDDRKKKKEYRIHFSVRESSEYIIFDIIDNGIGMDQETRENIFTLFFSSKGYRGTGLGLYISNQVVGQHGGKIFVESTPGEGSHFRISLPKAIPNSAKKSSKNNQINTSNNT